MLEKILNRLFHRENILGGDNDTLYMIRWTIIRTKYFRIMIHKMLQPDGDRCCHDHPFSFITFVLYGGYEEQIRHQDGTFSYKRNKPGIILYRRPEFSHRIAKLPKGISWTLVLRSGKIAEWGFWTKEGWKSWKEFLSPKNLKRFTLWCKTDD